MKWKGGSKTIRRLEAELEEVRKNTQQAISAAEMSRDISSFRTEELGIDSPARLKY
jgi:hypothetical protein